MRIKLRAERITKPIVNSEQYEVKITPVSTAESRYIIAATHAFSRSPAIPLSAEFPSLSDAAAAWKSGFDVVNSPDNITQLLTGALLDRGLAKRVAPHRSRN